MKIEHIKAFLKDTNKQSDKDLIFDDIYLEISNKDLNLTLSSQNIIDDILNNSHTAYFEFTSYRSKDLNELCNIIDIEGYLNGQPDTILPLGLEKDSLIKKIIRIPITYDIPCLENQSEQLNKTLDDIPLDDLIMKRTSTLIFDESDTYNVPNLSKTMSHDFYSTEADPREDHIATKPRVQIRYPTPLPFFSRYVMDHISKPIKPNSLDFILEQVFKELLGYYSTLNCRPLRKEKDFYPICRTLLDTYSHLNNAISNDLKSKQGTKKEAKSKVTVIASKLMDFRANL